MQENKVNLTWESLYDVTDIADYIEDEFGIERANKFQADMQQEFSKLEYTGSIFRETNILYRNYYIRMKPFPPSIIFYVLDDKENQIFVLRVLREEQDWENILRNNQDYTSPD
jgi:plasmid stabilization system protein ParE